jgi:transposase
MYEATHGSQYTTGPVLHLAFELGNTEWKLAFTTGLGQSQRRRRIDARDLRALEKEIRQAKKRFGLPEDVPVRSCYEAGREAFWLHRFLESRRIQNVVVDSASIEVNRRARRAKTDRLDVRKLLTIITAQGQPNAASRCNFVFRCET